MKISIFYMLKRAEPQIDRMNAPFAKIMGGRASTYRHQRIFLYIIQKFTT